MTPVTSTKLADREMIGGDLGADRDHLVPGDAEFRQTQFRLDMGDGEPPALGLGDILDLGRAYAELKRGIAVLSCVRCATT